MLHKRQWRKTGKRFSPESGYKDAGEIIGNSCYFGNRIILTNGFIKKSQKTPKSEIKLAKKYRDDYERRTNHD
ncbi:hypothetical protein B5F07_15680 [Lachnoclostridium sp. An169]|nr:hypothetical protein B5F07_15680 [Lachnoclostridium sp. An169]